MICPKCTVMMDEFPECHKCWQCDYEMRVLNKVIKMIRKSKGWIIAQEYKYDGVSKYNPVGKVYPDGSYSGFIYIYPNKKCAELSLMKLRHFKNMVIKKVTVKIDEKE